MGGRESLQVRVQKERKGRHQSISRTHSKHRQQRKKEINKFLPKKKKRKRSENQRSHKVLGQFLTTPSTFLRYANEEGITCKGFFFVLDFLFSLFFSLIENFCLILFIVIPFPALPN
jgi:hypothetical protein